MGEMIKVSVSRMSSDGEMLRQEIQEIPDAVRHLYEAMEALSACWEGSAREAFLSNMASDIDYMRELYNELKNYINVLEQAKGLYQKSQQSVCDKIGSIWV